MKSTHSVLIPCPVCSGTQLTHGLGNPVLDPPYAPFGAVWGCAEGSPIGVLRTRGHDWRFDKWSVDGPVLWRCRMCNAVAKMVSRESFRASATKPHAVIMAKVTANRLASGQTPIAPCDVCGGLGAVLAPTDGEMSGDGSDPRCPICCKSDRIVLVVPADENLDVETLERAAFGEVVLARDIDPSTHYCGRCDLRFLVLPCSPEAGLR